MPRSILEKAKEILEIPSPSGFTNKVVDYLKDVITNLNLTFEILNNGNLVVTVNGKTDKVVGLCAHVDTLGLIISGINANGTLSFDNIGGPIIPTLDSEYCQIHTRLGKVYTGTFLSNSPSVHVYKNASSLERVKENMHIRLDEIVHSKKDVLDLGISNGDFVSIDPKTVITDSGYIKSRFLDDKISVAILLHLLEEIHKKEIVPSYTLKIIFSVYEEVGFGCSYIPYVSELIAVDMGCVGLSLEGSEEKVSICAKDSAGPYNYDLTTKLINIARGNNLNYAVDVFPYYSSDVSAALKSGNNIRGALIGPGVCASHGMERTHLDGVMNCYKLLYLYITN